MTVPEAECFVCSLDGTQMEQTNDTWRVRCSRCGVYDLTGTASAVITNYHEQLYLLSGYIREMNERGKHPSFSPDDLKTIASLGTAPRNISDRVTKLIRYLGDHTENFGSAVRVDFNKDRPIIYAKETSIKEWKALLSFLEQSNLISTAPGPQGTTKDVTLTVNGMVRYEDVEKARIESDQAFIAMSFNPSLLDEIYDKVIAPTIEACGYKPRCVAKVEHNEDINDLIIAEIKKSKFIVAEFTEQKSGVYFESGFALGLGIPVIWCCHRCEKDRLHFDTEHFNHILWETPEELSKKLKNRIEATIT